MRSILIGAAAIALAAGTAFADPGKGQGGGGNGKADKGASTGAIKAGGGDKAHGKGHGGGEARGPAMKAEKAKGQMAGGGERADKGAAKAERRAEKREDRAKGGKSSEDRWLDRDGRVADRDSRDDRGARWVGFERDDDGLIRGCPPGLAKKNNGCMPPGLAKKDDRWNDGDWRSAAYRPDWFGYSSLGDGRYFYDDGYLYRMSDTGSVLGFVPLLGGALSVGNPWPSFYQPAPVDDYFVEYYNLGSPDSYRYADDVLYRVDPKTDAITSIAALLTGDRFNVGQPMPLGYDVYNVPYQYRDRYADGPDAHYRYADGYVYEVDPTTQLVQAAIELLT